jgi:glycosyltransferase involved in cell wall biosynthesis
MTFLSAVVLAKNEEDNIKDCIQTLGFCDEVVVIDDFSTDKTVEVAKVLGAKVFQRRLDGDFARQRNFGLSKAGGKWVLFIDADERIPEALAREILNKINDPLLPSDAYFIKRRDVLWGKALYHGEVGNVKLLRLAKKDAGVWARKVHEYWQVKAETSILKNTLTHYPHQSLKQLISEINFYSDLHAKANFDERKKSNLVKILLYPPLKFIKNYVFLLGFLDGTRGAILSFLMSFHSFLAWGDLWILQKNKKSQS